MTGDWAAEDLFFSVKGLRLPVGLVLDEVEVGGSRVRVETDPFALHIGTGATAIVRVSCDSLRDYLGSLELGGLRDIAVETEGGLLKVSATAVVLVPIRAVAFCSLEVREGRALNVVLQSAEPGPAYALIERQLKGVNPVLDLRGLSLDMTIESVEIEDRWVVLHAVGG